MRITLKSIHIENFKGIKSLDVSFSERTTICGQNAVGKTSVFDAFTFCLFGKDSKGSEKFEIRPLDSFGNKIHNVVISVECVFDVDGVTRSLKRSVSENWVKKRGNEQKTLQGNVGSYEVDGYPRSEKEYKEFVKELVDEDVFKMITSPMYFTSLPWKEQRSILMNLVSEQSDAVLARSIGGFEDILDELEKAPSTDDIQKKYQKSMSELKKIQNELPVRIDEVHRQIQPVAKTHELEAKRTLITDLIKDENEKITETTKANERIIEINREVGELRASLSTIQVSANAELNEKRTTLEMNLTNAKTEKRIKESELAELERAINQDKEMLSAMEAKREALRKEYASAKALVFDETSNTCPMCKQILPKDQIEVHRKEFESKKKETLERVEKDGKSCADLVATITDRINSNEAKIEKAKVEIETANKNIESVMNEVAGLPSEVVAEDTEEYKEVVAMMDKKAEELAGLNAAITQVTTSARANLEDLKQQLKEVDDSLAVSNANEELMKRVSELESEQRDVAQKVMDCEKILYLVESFIKAKMDAVSEQINSKFDGIKFKLFDYQINGGLKETCECTVNGVPYASANNGHRIIAGLQIIKTLQSVFDSSAPIFVDNSEAVNEYNYPHMDCQMVFLQVTDDKELKVGAS